MPGADINNYEYIKSCLRNDDFIVFCDSGLRHLESLQVTLGLIVGDFDSHDNPNLDVETIVLPCEKDDTDTVFAVKEAIKRGFDDFLLICAVGARLDHTLCNVSILLYHDSLGKKGKIIDPYWFGATLKKENGYFYLIDEENMDVNEISEDYCWFKARSVRYRLIPH